jgi:hypothetical protein
MRRGKRLDYRARRKQKRIIIGVVILIVLLAVAGVILAKSGTIAKIQGIFVNDETQAADNSETQAGKETNASDDGSTQTQETESVSAVEQLWESDTRTPVDAKGIYVTGSVAGNSSTISKLKKLMKKNNLNTMIIDIKNDSGEISYQMDNKLAKQIGATNSYIRDMKTLVKELKKDNIYLVARVVAFKDPILAKEKEAYSIHTSDGNVYKDSNGDAWVNPYNKKVWKYLVDIADEVHEIGFDEVQYSYVRFLSTSASDIDYGKSAKGVSKTEAINNFLQYAYEKLATKGMYVSAEVYGASVMHEQDGESIGQNFKEMAALVDYVCPMIYPSYYVEGAYSVDVPDQEPYDLVLAAVKNAQKQLKEVDGHVAQIRPWLQSFSATWIKNYTTYKKEQVEAQIQAVEKCKLNEWMLWSPTNQYPLD